jgi:hypothetical protein
MRLRLSLAATAFLSVSASAQLAAFEGVGIAIRTLQEREMVPRPIQPIPTQDPGWPVTPPREGRLPPPEPVEDPRRLEVVFAGELEQEGDIVRLGGGIEVLYRGFRIFAREMVGNLATEVFDLRGEVRLIGTDAVVVGERVIVNFPTEEFRAFDSEAQLRPSLVQGNVRDDLYVRGSEAFGTRLEVRGLQGSFTTCPYDRPHYEIVAREVVVRPNRRAIFRGLELRIVDRTVLRLPYLSVPLTEPAYRYLPEVGQSAVEGVYVRTRYGLPAGGENHFDARFDYYTRLGTGIGGDYRYQTRGMRGVLETFGLLSGLGTVLVNSRHNQEFGFGNLTVESSFSRNNYLVAPDTTLLSSRAQLMIPQGPSSSRLHYFLNSTQTSGFRTEQQTLGLTDLRVVGPRTRSTLDVNWVSSTSRFGEGEGIEREQVDVRGRAQHDLHQALAEVEYQRSIPVGDVTNFFSPSDRTPVLRLVSDARRLLGPQRAQGMPFNTELSIGEFTDARTRSRIGRGMFDFNFRRPGATAHRLRFDMNGRFRQTFYTDDTAQYILNFGSTASYRLGGDTAFNLRYNYLRPYGFSPLAIDRSGRTHLASVDLSFRPTRALRVGAQTGYDVLQLERQRTPWQTVGLRVEYRPAETFDLRALSTYDPARSTWSNLRFDLGYRMGPTFFGLGARYDGLRHTWGNVNFLMQGFQWGRLSTSALLAYNGYLRRFDATQLSFNYDLHDAELIFQVLDTPTGFRSGTQVSVFLRLKALPFDTPFGIGGRGQPIGIGTGRDF